MIFQAEEHPAVPARARDGPGNGRQRFVGATLPVETVGRDGDEMLDALPFTDQTRADDRFQVGAEAAFLPIAAVQLFAEGFQPLHRFRLQAAVGQFLDAVGEAAFEVAAIERGRCAVEQLTPLLLQVGGGGCFQSGQAGRDGILLGHAFLR